ncbi:MAG: DNA-binding protein Alba [Candidatus Verstraetearchaeota archaeon]|nr:DNA-binding protein Alba [Candidatus Verstraetearchaeota archaeon]
MSQENSILIGKKPPMNYVLACLTAFHEGAEEVVIKARGRPISTAVDVAEMVRKKFMPSAMVSEITIGTEEVQLKEGGVKRTSSIMIRMRKKK